MKEGIYYIATGQKHVLKANTCAKKITSIAPDLNQAIATDKFRMAEGFDEIIRVSNPQQTPKDKVNHISRTPFERTIYLDTDIHPVRRSGFVDLFSLLNKYEIATTLAESREQDYFIGDLSRPPVDIPCSFPMRNAGCIAYKKTKNIESLFDNWKRIYKDHIICGEHPNNQPSFRKALWETEVNDVIFPSEYNFNIRSSNFASGEVKILHGNANNYDEIDEVINRNRTVDPRAYHPAFTTRNQPPSSRRIDPWVASANEEASVRLLINSIKEIGILQSALCYMLGGPISGRERWRMFKYSLENRGIINTIRRSVEHIKKEMM